MPSQVVYLLMLVTVSSRALLLGLMKTKHASVVPVKLIQNTSFKILYAIRAFRLFEKLLDW